jgi:HlyD family secretion protein
MNTNTNDRKTVEITVKRILLASTLVAGLAACKAKPAAPVPIPTAVATRRNLTVTAEATGKIEPIQIIDIKSKAGGQIITLTVESGSRVRKGDLLVELDKRDVSAALQQAKADLESSKASLENSKRLFEQNQKLFEAGVITRREFETSETDVTRQNAAYIRSQQSVELAQQRYDDATIVAPSDGVILDKLVSVGTVIASASNSASGGTNLLKMADLSRVRARILVSETDIGKVQVGMVTRVQVDAYPNRPFEGIVEKMEPQATVDQNVTMFPVLVSLDNEEGALMPGMNGEVSILVDEKSNVLTIPLDAFRLANEAKTIAEMFGLKPEQVDSAAAVGQQNARNRASIVMPVRDDSASQQVDIGRGNQPQNGAGRNGQGGQQPGQQGNRGGRGGPEVTDEQCKTVLDAYGKNTALQARVDSLRNKLMDADPAARQGLIAEMRTSYEKAGLDQQVVNACQRREGGGNARGGNGRQGGTGRATQGGGGFGGAAGGGGTGGRGGRAGRQGGGTNFGNLGQRNQGLGVRGQGLAQSGIVFVQVGVDTTVKPAKGKFEARYVQLGAQNYDFAEVTDGLQEGEVVALMAAAKIEMQRRQAAERQKANTSLIPGLGQGGRGMPGMGGDFGPRGGGGPGGAGGGGGPRGGGGGGSRGGRGG